MSFFIVSHSEFLILVNKNNLFYGLFDCNLSIGVIPITSLSKLLVGVKPGDEFSFIGLIGVIPIPPLIQFCRFKIFSVTKLPLAHFK